MKQLFMVQSKGVVIEEVPAPAPADGRVLVKVAYSLVSSGTESAQLKTEKSLLSKVRSQPEVVAKVVQKIKEDGVRKTTELVKGRLDKLSATGYSCAGTVVEVGKDVKTVSVGDRVACAGSGYASHAEIVSVPENLVVRVPADLDFPEAAFVTLGSIAMHGVRRANVTLGETVAVIGLGVIGQLTCQILTAAGCRAIGIDLSAERVEIAARLGADQAFVGSEEDEAKVRSFTGGVGADAAIICAGASSSDIVNRAARMLRDKGALVVVGAVGMDLDRSVIYEKEIDFLISRSYGPGRYDADYEERGLDYPIGYVRWTERRNMAEFLRLAASGRIDLKSLVSKVFPLEEAKQAYSSLASPDILGVLFKYPDAPTETARKISVSTKAAGVGQVNIGVIGGGEFAARVHLPNIKSLPGAHLRAVATAGGGHAKELAKRFQAEYCTTDYQELLKDEELTAVLIATRHNLHAPMAIEAARAKKHILVEKPLALSNEEAQATARAVEENGVLLSIGFNRRFAPLAVEAKKLLVGKPAKTVVCRINAGFVLRDHWVNDPVEGGGRIIGEACHFFDLIYWLLEEEPISVYAAKTRNVGESYVEDDNLTCVIEYAGGSTAELVYTTTGTVGFSKERLEIFTGGDTVVLDDFKRLEAYGSIKKEITAREDKGHLGLIENFVKALAGQGELGVTVGDGVRATACCVAALRSAAERRPVGI